MTVLELWSYSTHLFLFCLLQGTCWVKAHSLRPRGYRRESCNFARPFLCKDPQLLGFSAITVAWFLLPEMCYWWKDLHDYSVHHKRTSCEDMFGLSWWFPGWHGFSRFTPRGANGESIKILHLSSWQTLYGEQFLLGRHKGLFLSQIPSQPVLVGPFFNGGLDPHSLDYLQLVKFSFSLWNSSSTKTQSISGFSFLLQPSYVWNCFIWSPGPITALLQLSGYNCWSYYSRFTH